MTSKVPGVSLMSYVAGFAFSLILTLEAYWLVSRHVASDHTTFSHRSLIAWIISLALVQFIVQLIFFLHLNREARPRWNLVALFFAIGVVIILFFGSVWIMQNLDYHHDHRSPQETDTYIIQDEGIGQ